MEEIKMSMPCENCPVFAICKSRFNSHLFYISTLSAECDLLRDYIYEHEYSLRYQNLSDIIDLFNIADRYKELSKWREK